MTDEEAAAKVRVAQGSLNNAITNAHAMGLTVTVDVFEHASIKQEPRPIVTVKVSRPL